MVKLAGTFSKLGHCKVMVIGDLMLDTYTIGKARRISPEAPVAVIQVQQEEHRPGGAGNVMLNLISLGAEVVAIGRIGQDGPGTTLLQDLQAENIDVRGVVVQKGFKTPVKNRIIAEGQQIVRIDHETIVPIPELVEQQVVELFPQLLEGVHIVAISDYGKGFLSRTMLAALIEQARGKGIPVIADPKGIDFTKYLGVTILKPNLGEAYAAANVSPEKPLEHAAAKVLELSQAEVLMITRSESGISLFHRDGSSHHFPVQVREVKDVTGAGDTVLAMLACGLANGLPLSAAVQLSNVAAGIAIEHFGCARVSLSDLARRLLEHDVVNKVFDEEHLFALQKALKGRKFTLLGIEGIEHISSSLFRAIRKLSQTDGIDLLVYVRDHNPKEEFISLLASLHDIQFIIVNGENLKKLCHVIKPEAVYMYVKDDLQALENSNLLIGSV